MSSQVESVLDRLDAARQRWWLFSLLSSAVAATCLSLAVLLAFLLADAAWRLSQPALVAGFLVWVAISAALAVGLFRRLLRGERSLEATARRVEAHFPELGSNLINVVQLADESPAPGAVFRQSALGQAADAVGASAIAFDRAAVRVTRWQRFRWCMQTPRDLIESIAILALLLALGLVCHMTFPAWGSAAHRLFSPWSFVPQQGEVEILEVMPGDIDVLIGSSLVISAKIKPPVGRPRNTPFPAAAWIAVGPSNETRFPMTADSTGTQYRLAMPAVTSPMAYRLEIGDSQTRVYRVGVREKPTVAEVEVVYHFPRYLARRPRTVRQSHADLEAPQYTVAELRIRPSTPVARGWVESRGMTYPGRVDEDGRRVTIARLPMVADGSYTIHLENDAGHGDPEPRANRLRVVPDQPPAVSILKPPRQSTAAPGQAVTLVLRAIDDHGLSRARLEMRQDESTSAKSDTPASESVETIHAWPDLGTRDEAVLRHDLVLDAARVAPGQTLFVRAVAADGRAIDASEWGEELRAQETVGPWHAIRLIEPDRKIEAELERLDSLRAAIYRILLDQIRARTDTATLDRRNETEQASRLIERIRSGQIQIQKDTAALVETIDPDDSEATRKTRRGLSTLATGAMLDAVRQVEQLRSKPSHIQKPSRIKKPSRDREGAVDSRQKPPPLPHGRGSDRDVPSSMKPARELSATQQTIIAALRGLLDVVRRAESELLAQMEKRPGGDLPNDTRQRLSAAKEKLEEFLRQQKKVIEATENLAKKPVEDFTEEEKELMRQLAATEDEWARFLQELHTDLSKLPEQDFANPSLLGELNEIQTEIKMAADALTKKTADIAVPLEQLGAEMAEELLTNMEKWLPDTPDRERWSQEESLTDLDKEAPMAELPGELEDLVGELFEEEEDLMEEVEDASSSATDSLDVGAGWDAMDGPISNMSAKGVTGNRLPNTSEIGGRSGEGRSGKSSGEFVAEEAVGKGGRRTPSRLTPDPFEKGQVKDHSRDPVGGATGGGKESGQGGEGLEGPQRRPPGPRETERLAGRQAALRNKAEAIDLKFQIMNFHRADLEKMIEAMAQVEHDLRAGRYQNALRQRNVLAEGLGSVKQYLEGQVELRQDTSVNLPGDVQKDILGGMQDPSPPGWEELNRQYYERLSKGEGKTKE
ncbi:MAG TPA: hypothetical protein VJL29_15400 [Thermoguttaceae bacterium]|nr:hypothetical protein [Thermoguttaceae bacterium]